MNVNKFSIVVPVYNSEQYLRKCVDSLVAQTVDKSMLEIILVNDGSTDGSAELCEDYAKKYPFVIHVEQENAGVSRARNKGIEVATGDYIGFVDSDDWVSKNIVAKVDEFYSNCSDKVNVAVCPVYNMHGARKKPHYANGKFSKGSRVVSLHRPKWSYVVSRIAPAFFRTEAIKGLKLDEKVTYYEDTKFCSEALMGTMLLGIVSGCAYYYRRNSGEEGDEFSSLTATATDDPSFYLESPKRVSLDVLEKCVERFGSVPKYYQFASLAEMKWRIFYNHSSAGDVLSGKELEEYKHISDQIMSYIDFETILECGLYTSWQKAYLMSLKHGSNILDESKFDETGTLLWGQYELGYAPDTAKVLLMSMHIKNGEAQIKGFYNELIRSDAEVYARVAGDRVNYDLEYEGPPVTKYTLLHEDYVATRRAFDLRIPLDSDKVRIEFFYKIQGREYPVKSLALSSAIDIDSLRPVERVEEGWILRRSPRRLEVERKTTAGLGKMYLAKAKRAARRVVKSKLGK